MQQNQSRATIRLLAALSASALVSAAAFTISCGGRPPKPQIVATTPLVAELVRNVAGDKLIVRSLMTPGTDAHEFEPRARAASEIRNARVVFASGGGIDPWARKLTINAGTNTKFVDLSRRLPEEPEEMEGVAAKANTETDAADPHWWHDPLNAKAAVDRIATVLGRTYPKHSGFFQHMARNYRGRILALDRRIARCLARIPRADRELVTTHNAFNHFAHRYSLRVAGSLIPSTSTEAQPSAGETQGLVRRIKREKVRAIFTERSADKKLAQAVAEETGVSLHGPLYADTLGPRNSDASTYLEMMRHNAHEIVKGLAPSSPCYL